MNVYISPTLLGQVKKCPRCVYDPLALKLKSPRGIMPSLPNGMDETLKKYTDSYRGTLPPELESLGPDWVIHPDQKLIDGLRQWNGLKAVHKFMKEVNKKIIQHMLTVQGGIDELLLHTGTKEIMILDFKTKATEPPLEYAKQYYQETMEAYAWLLKKLAYRVISQAYLWYWFPISAVPIGKYQFGTKLLPMELDWDNTRNLLDKIGDMLPGNHAEVMEKRPEPSPECELCTFVSDRMNLEEERKEVENQVAGEN